MICPKCGRPVDESAVICRGCDFILDTGFLGADILDEEHTLRPGTGGVDPGAFNLADAVILGNIDDDSQSFETSDSGFHMQAHLNARLYVSGRSQALMAPDAVPALAQSVDGAKLTPFEKHVMAFIDGKKPVEVIRRAAGLDEAEVKTALATLADKGFVKVVGRALADFDSGNETAPRRAPPRHRMRGSVVGAVALVGDEADKAIEDAFRTQVALSPLLGAGAKLAAGGGDGDVFSRTSGLDDLPSDIDQFVGMKGTDEIEKPVKKSDASSSTLRPSAHKGAVNRAPGGKLPTKRVNPEDSQEGIDASADASAVERSIVDKSDGFDDFGQPSDVSTAVVAQEYSESSSPSASPSALPSASDLSERPRSGVFADISESDVPTPLGALQNLADSRVQQRPKLPQLTNAKPAQRLASDSHSEKGSPAPAGAAPPPLPPVSHEETPSVEMERDAASGEVWGDLGADSASSPRPPSAPKAQNGRETSAKMTLSSSLSDLLSDKDQKEATANVPPEKAARMIAAGQQRRAAQDEPSSFEEPTAAGQPPPPMVLPRVAAPSVRAKMAPPAAGAPAKLPPAMATAKGPSAKLPAPAKAPAVSVVAAAAPPPRESTNSRSAARDRPPTRGSAMVSMPDEVAAPAARNRPLDEQSGLHEVERAAKPRGNGGAASDIFDDDDDESVDGLAPTGSVQSPQRRTNLGEPSQFVQSIEVNSVHESGDETAPPSQIPESELPSESTPRAIAASESDPSESMSSSPDTSDVGSDSRSVEMVDSALLIRPAAKAMPLAVAAQKARGSRPRTMASMEQSSSASDPKRPQGRAAQKDDPDATFARSLEESLSLSEKDELPASEPSNEDSEDTVNFDADQLRKRGLGQKENVVAGGRAGVAAIPSGFSQVVAPPDAPRVKVTDENRRKARNLFESAVKEAEAGRLAPARMNAKLASIYDPDTPEYKRQLDAWERPATQAKPAQPTAQQSQNNSKPSDESQAEIKALYDEAQRYEDTGDVDEALDILEQGVSRYPQAAAFHNRIGVILALRKRDYEAAVQAIQRAIDIDPDNLHYKSNLGKIVAKMRGRGQPEA